MQICKSNLGIQRQDSSLFFNNFPYVVANTVQIPLKCFPDKQKPLVCILSCKCQSMQVSFGLFCGPGV